MLKLLVFAHKNGQLSSCRKSYSRLKGISDLQHSWAFVCRNYSPSSLRKGGANQQPTIGDANLNVGHSRFLAEASPMTKWKQDGFCGLSNDEGLNADEFEGIADGKGKLSPTTSHLFKLILPLGNLSHPGNTRLKPNSNETHTNESKPHTPPTVILLHPSQPLSHVSQLITASLAPAVPIISFRSTSTRGNAFQWSNSTDVGDFIRDAARAAHFSICITYDVHEKSKHSASKQAPSQYIPISADSSTSGPGQHDGVLETIIDVDVPTFADRTRFLRRRLNAIESKIQSMEVLKAGCDKEAHRGARRMAMSGFGMLIVYWAAVARLTFWDYGWEVMEPVTYLSGLSMVILGYLWFLYQGREVSYTSVLAQSVSKRREALYRSRGLDIERWLEFVTERKGLRREIGRIAEDYEDSQEDSKDEEDKEIDLGEDSVEAEIEATNGGRKSAHKDHEEEKKGRQVAAKMSKEND